MANHYKDQIGVKGCELAVGMVQDLPIEHENHEHMIGYVASTLRWQANRIEVLEAAVRAVRASDGDNEARVRLYDLYALVPDGSEGGG